jgi:hypothetical protein
MGPVEVPPRLSTISAHPNFDRLSAMREDMFEVIIERPRRGSRWLSHARRAGRHDAKVDVKRDPDAMLRQIGLKRWARMGRGTKSLNENLAPLRRFLESQVNRPWDKVWSEISENLSASSTVQQHVRDHVVDFVATRAFMKDGAVWVSGRYGRPEPLRDSRYRMYVDPRTGILRKNKFYESWSRQYRAMKAQAEKHRASRMRELSGTMQAHKLDDDCWWEVRLAPIPTRIVTGPRVFGAPMTHQVREPFTDVVFSAKLSEYFAEYLYGREGVYACAKRQLSRREIDRLGLPR